MASNIGTAFGQVVIGSNTSGLAAARRGLAGFAKGGAVALTALAVTFGALGATSVKTAAGFQQDMANVASVADATRPQLAALADQAMEVGPALGYGAREGAKGQFELAKAGLSVSEILGGAYEGALSLAAAGEVGVGSAAEYAANAMNIFGLGGKDVAHIADALATAANVTTADVDDLGMSLTQGGAAARLAGYGLDDTVAVIEALADSSVKGSDAGTSMKNGLLQLLNPTAKQSKLQKELGLSLLDSNGALKDGAGLAEQLRKGTAGMTKAQRTATFATLAGTDGLRLLDALYAAGPARMRRYEQGLARQGSAAETARIRQNTLQGATKRLMASMEVAGITIGTALLPPLAEGAESLAGFISAAANSPQASRAITAMASGAESALSGLGSALTSGAVVSGLQAVYTTAEGVGDAVGTVWDGIGPDAVALAQTLMGSVVPAAQLTGSALMAAATAMTPMAALLLTVAQGAATTAAAVLSLGSSFASTAAGQSVLIMAVTGLIGAYTALRVAALGAMAAQRANAIMGAVTAFMQLASTVRTAAQAMQLLSLAVNPVAAIGLGIGVLVGGFLALQSGMFAGASAAERLAERMGHVKAQADAAEAATRRLKDTSSGLADSRLRVKEAVVASARAERDYKAAVDQYGRSSLEAREADVRRQRATLELNRARKTQASDERSNASAVARSASASARSVTEMDRARRGIAQELQVRRQLAIAKQKSGTLTDAERQSLAALEQSYRKTARQVEIAQKAAMKQAAGMKANTPAARELKRALEAVGSANPRGLEKFSTAFAAAKDRGLKDIDALKSAASELGTDDIEFSVHLRGGALGEIKTVRRQALQLDGLTAEPTVTIDGDQAMGTVRGVNAELDRTNNRVVRARIEVTRVERTTTSRGGGGGGGQTADDLARDLDALAEQARRIDGVLERMDRQDANRANERRKRDLKEALEDARRQLRQAKDAEARRGANRAVRDAKEALADYHREMKREPKRTALTDAREAADAMVDAFSSAESAVSDLIGRIGQAIDDRLTESIKALDAELERAGRSNEDLWDAIGAGMQQGFGAGRRGEITQQLISSLDGSAVGQAAATDFMARFGADLSVGFGTLSKQIEETLKASLERISNSAEARRVTAIGLELDARRVAREDRDQQKALQEATSEAEEANAKVARLQEAAARARTAAERRAAEAMLREATTAQTEAAQKLADAQEAISSTALEREAAQLEQKLATQRQAAEDAAQIDRDSLTARQEAAQIAYAELQKLSQRHYSDSASERRAALEQQAADEKAAAERSLGSLVEDLRARRIKWREFMDGVAGITNDPKIRLALNASGEKLGLAFSAGLNRSMLTVEKSAKAMADMVAKYLRLRSPAETGPLAHDFRRSGAVIGEDLAAGMATRRRMVEAEATRMAAAAARAGVGAGVGPGAWAGGGDTYNQYVDVHVQDPVEDARAAAARMSYELRMSGGRFS